jgi:hypothetical protein
LFSTDWRDGKGRSTGMLRKMAPRSSHRSEWTSEELHRICKLIESWPGRGAPDMDAIYRRVRAERLSGRAA